MRRTGALTDRAVAAIFLGLAVLLVLGYLFVSKLMDISKEEGTACWPTGATAPPRTWS